MVSLDDIDDDELEKQEKVVFGKSFGANDKAFKKAWSVWTRGLELL